MARIVITDEDVETVNAEFPEVSASDVRQVLEDLDGQTVGVAIDWGWSETTVLDELSQRFDQLAREPHAPKEGFNDQQST